MFSFIAKSIGQLAGEAAHQTGKLVDDILNIPNALAEGYKEEIFETKPTVEATPPTKAEVPTDVQAS